MEYSCGIFMYNKYKTRTKEEEEPLPIIVKVAYTK